MKVLKTEDLLPNEEITGAMYLNVTKLEKMERIRFVLEGKEHTKFSTGSGEDRRNHSDSNIFMQIEGSLIVADLPRDPATVRTKGRLEK